ncbi:OmpA family protein [Psychromonas algarum]|uniref:OmpA family protein n=1 Tax=Psychromonas algarum TaxID=2555643 RepID=UPI00141A249E|nr:OmpA family protein [Psychromonas sp. RZ22]
MRKINLLTLTSLLLLAGCAENANMKVDRYQFDDLRDYDQDGIINQRDLCETTPPNVLVDNDGCAFWTDVKNISWFPIDFKFDSSELLEENMIDLIRAVATLKQNPDTKLVLIGDTSGEGSLEYNSALAERRNLSVRSYLISKGVEESRVEMETFNQPTSFTSHLKLRKRRTIAVFIDTDKVFDEAWNIYTSDPENK